MTIPAIILAAGASRRLGVPKQTVLFRGETLLERTIRIVREAGVQSVFVVLGANRAVIEGAVNLLGVQVVDNPEWPEGMSSSVRVGVRAVLAAFPEAPGLLMLACDQVFLKAEHVSLLVANWIGSGRAEIVASGYEGRTGVPAILSASHFERLLALEGDYGARNLLRDPELRVQVVPFPGGELDLDTPADLESLHNSKI